MVNAAHDFTEHDKVVRQYRELQAAAYNRRIKAALVKTTAKMVKDIAFLILCLGLVGAMTWIMYSIWIG
jgi:hypothetical protein